MQSGPIRNRTRHLLGENLLASRFDQRVVLQGKILVYGRNAGIADQHRFRRDMASNGWRCRCARDLLAGRAGFTHQPALIAEPARQPRALVWKRALTSAPMKL